MDNIEIHQTLKDLRSIKLKDVDRTFVLRCNALYEQFGTLTLPFCSKLKALRNKNSDAIDSLHAAREKAVQSIAGVKPPAKQQSVKKTEPDFGF